MDSGSQSQVSSSATNGASGVTSSDLEASVQRIKDLAAVGNALAETASEKTYLTNFYLAEEALNRFKSRIDEVQLDAASRQGINHLVDYLKKKVSKRMQNAETRQDLS